MSNYDEALERFHRVDLEYGEGLANHGPMGAEALETLGHHALIPAFVDIYVPRLPACEPGKPLVGPEVDLALGEIGRSADWVATLEARLEGGDWRAVVAAEVPELLPGTFAAAGHGLLRTAHAIRALEREDTPLRRRELARGLAYWAARFQPLPGLPGSRCGESGLDLTSAFADWPLVGETEARAGLFFRVVERLESFSAFARRVEEIAVPTSDSLEEFLTQLCRTAATLYLANPQARVAYVHALTIPSALRLVAPHIPERDACLGAAFALQAVGALHSIFGEIGESPPRDEEVVRVAEDWDEIRYHAACSIQEHSIKMAEACWREDRLAPDSVFGLAAADAALKIEGRGQPQTC